ncbi:MAG: META domain-containing protein [Dehalococcoidia bacterium]|nr:MAG: META domain-containing protein [Dehalococcoidia bacterium]
MKRHIVIAASLIIAALSISTAGCASRDSGRISDSFELAGTSWHLQSYGLASQQKTLLSSTEITLVFDGNASHISGNAGINLYGGDCEIHGSGISISQIYQTQLGSPDISGVTQQENDYLTLLAKAERFSEDCCGLIIFCDGGELHFVSG